MKCPECKKEYKKTSNSQKFCSTKCQQRSYRRKNREKLNKKQRIKWRKKHVTGDTIKCEICGLSFRQVGTHIVQRHGMTAREYREEYGFDVKRGQLPEDLRELKAEYVFENGTINNLKKGSKYRFKKGQKGVGVYKRSDQTIKRLKHEL